jgi:C_GCAxxG_C_C family probable redox protein
MTKDAALKLFGKGFNCAQSVLSAKSDLTHLSVTESLKIATGFGAGMAMAQKTCGAVTGAYMVIGAVHGRVNPDDEASRDKTYGLISEFNRRFSVLHECLTCRELLGVDLQSEEGLEEAEKQGYFQSRCATFVADAEKILDEILK